MGAAIGQVGGQQTTQGLREHLEALQSRRDRLFGRLLHGEGGQSAASGAASAAVLAVALALALHVLGAMLALPGSWGIEDWLGWVDRPGDAPRVAALGVWSSAGVIGLARLYLSADTLLFVPAYLLTLLALAGTLAGRLAADRAEQAGEDGASDAAATADRLAGTGWGLVADGLVAALLALALVDLTENVAGLLQVPPALAFDAAVWALAVLLVPPAIDALGGLVPALRARVVAAAIVLVAIALGWQMRGGGSCRPESLGRPSWLTLTGCGAHHAKGVLALAVAVLFGLLVLAWFFGLLQKRRSTSAGPDMPVPPGAPAPLAPAPATPAQARAELRAAVGDMLLRSRYVLIALALFGGLTLGMDQARDIIYADADAPPTFAAWAGAAVGLGLGALATWAFAFACWLWTRSVCMIVAAGHPQRDGPDLADRFARGWARLLSLLPYLMLALLCSGVIRDASLARYTLLAGASDGRQGDHAASIITVVTLFAVGTVVLGLVFVRVRIGNAQQGYYNVLPWQQWAQDAEFTRSHSRTRKYRLLRVVPPYWLPIVALAGALLCRAIDLTPGGSAVPSLAFAEIAFSLTFWLCLFGWLSMLESVRAVPYVLLLILVAGVAGWLGWTDNHRVWPPIAQAATQPGAFDTAYRMLAFSAALAAIVLLAYALAMSVARRGVAVRGPRRAVAMGGALVVALAALLAIASQAASPRQPWSNQAAAQWARPVGRLPVDKAMGRWLNALCAEPETRGCSSEAPAALPVYLVSTEGGGIRAAVWTADVLNRLASGDARFLARTFSISGVSGGAVGAAAFRACETDKRGRAACLQAFARADYVAPLLSAWMFEDVLAQVLPTAECATPGCGFLTRAAWFESRLEAAAPGLREPLSRTHSDDPGRPTPYLLLNSTWVETGERAIASDLQIDSAHFPGARDQLAIAGHDLPLSTAAHNAARFPYVNPIGTFRAPQGPCLLRDDAALHAPEAASAPPPAQAETDCGHLADGGYFDNPGGQSTVDALASLVHCLTATAPAGQAANGCGLPEAHRTWLRAHVLPTVVFIRNGVPLDEGADQCDAPSQPASTVLTVRHVPACNAPAAGTNAGGGYRPERPRCGSSASLYVDAIGPLFALLHAGGTGAHAALSEVRQREAITEARRALGSPAGSALPPLVMLAQRPVGVRYPLGWHLSGAAADGLSQQAVGCHL